MPKSRRTKEPVFDELVETLQKLPAWIGPVAALFVYAALRWVAPWLASFAHGPNATFVHSLFATLARLAPFFALAVFVMWVVAEGRKFASRKLLDRQTASSTIATLTWREFETLLCEAFRRQGFVVEHTGRGQSDGGVDQRLTKAGATTLVQCKHWQSRRVGVTVVRELLGLVASERAQSGIVVTNGGFTTQAIEFAERNPIRLIDGGELLRMIREVQSDPDRAAGGDANPDSRRTIPPEPPLRSAFVCPACGAAMVPRTARKGANAGSRFLGCSRFPQCRATRPME